MIDRHFHSIENHPKSNSSRGKYTLNFNLFQAAKNIEESEKSQVDINDSTPIRASGFKTLNRTVTSPASIEIGKVAKANPQKKVKSKIPKPSSNKGMY